MHEELTIQIDLPSDTINLAQRLASGDQDAATVIGEALNKLAREREKVAAVQEGIDAYERGDYQSLEEFGRELSERYCISLPGQ